MKIKTSENFVLIVHFSSSVATTTEITTTIEIIISKVVVI